MTTKNKSLISDAKAFAKKKHGGVSARVREMLDELKPGIAILVNERLSIQHIQEFCREKGLKIGIGPLRQYCQDNFNYPPRKKTGASNNGEG